MKKFLAVTTIAGSILVLPPKADAQVAVLDAANLAQNVQELAQDVTTVEQLKSQLSQLQQTYSMFTSPTNVLGMAAGLENQGVENPMPAVNSLSGLIGGQTAPTGAGVTFYNQNHIYTAPGSSTDATQLNENGTSIANIQGIAATNLAAIQARLQELPSLESDLNSASSITQVAAINGRIAAESQFVQAQQAQAANLQVLANEQQASQEQQQAEAHQQSDADALAALNAATQ